MTLNHPKKVLLIISVEATVYALVYWPMAHEPMVADPSLKE